jgi:CheY-like chemotaxis protein
MDNSLSGRRILVVEDEMMVLMLIEDMLADLGCESVSTAATVDRALALMDGRTFDVAMLDVNLNGQNSYPVADALATRGIPFVFATGYGDHVTRARYPERPVLQKPFKFERLVETLSGLLVERGLPHDKPAIATATGPSGSVRG